MSPQLHRARHFGRRILLQWESLDAFYFLGSSHLPSTTTNTHIRLSLGMAPLPARQGRGCWRMLRLSRRRLAPWWNPRVHRRRTAPASARRAAASSSPLLPESKGHTAGTKITSLCHLILTPSSVCTPTHRSLRPQFARPLMPLNRVYQLHPRNTVIELCRRKPPFSF